MAKHQRHLRNYLLDRKFQLRFTVAIVLISSVLTTCLGYFWYDEMRKASRIVEVKALTTMTDAEVKTVEGEMASEDRKRLAILVGFGVLIAFVLAGFSIVFTHRVAGPLFKISRHMKDIAADDLKDVRDLRKGDQLQEFWFVFRDMHTQLRERQRAEIDILQKALGILEEGGATSDVRKELAALVEAKKLSLGETQETDKPS